MEIPGYTYITHKLIQRPWGCECRFTLKKEDKFFDDVIDIPSMGISEGDLIERIASRMTLIDRPPEIIVDPMLKMVEDAVAAKEEEIKKFLVSKGVLSEGQEISEISAVVEE